MAVHRSIFSRSHGAQADLPGDFHARLPKEVLEKAAGVKGHIVFIMGKHDAPHAQPRRAHTVENSRQQRRLGFRTDKSTVFLLEKTVLKLTQRAPLGAS